jgi:DNA-binding NarL/FixJ family response regulator
MTATARPSARERAGAQGRAKVCVAALDAAGLERLRRALAASFEVVDAEALEEATDHCRGGRAEAVVLECAPAEIRADVAALRSDLVDVPIVVVAEGDGRHGVRRALRAGADGYVRVDDVERVLMLTVNAALAGQLCVSNTGRGQLARAAFSPRERQILQLLAAGLTNHQIADRLYLSENTVKSHVASSLRKLGVSSRSEAAALVRDAAVAVAVPPRTAGERRQVDDGRVKNE